MPNETPRAAQPGSSITGDRRQPDARYVQFVDQDVQSRFIAAAENAHRRLVALDRFAGPGEVALPSVPSPAAERGRRGHFRRPRTTTPAPVVVPSTAALATVARLTSDAGSDRTPPGCPHVHRVSRTMAAVATELVHDLVVLDPTEQAAHPAYRQMLRLAAELDGIRDLGGQVTCTSTEDCVGIRAPGHWGGRVEDVEVDEVRDVLLQLAIADQQ